jgi:hypothetical protein
MSKDPILNPVTQRGSTNRKNTEKRFVIRTTFAEKRARSDGGLSRPSSIFIPVFFALCTSILPACFFRSVRRTLGSKRIFFYLRKIHEGLLQKSIRYLGGLVNRHSTTFSPPNLTFRFIQQQTTTSTTEPIPHYPHRQWTPLLVDQQTSDELGRKDRRLAE